MMRLLKRLFPFWKPSPPIPEEVRKFALALGYRKVTYLQRWHDAKVYEVDRGGGKTGLPLLLLHDRSGVRAADYGEIYDILDSM